MSESVQMLYEIMAGKPVPILPRNEDGSIRQPDELAVLSIDQTARRFNLKPEDLRRGWLETWRRLISFDDLEALGAVPPSPETDETSPIGRSPEPPLVGDELLWQMRYPDFSRSQFAYFLEGCRRLELDPWKEEIFADLQHDTARKLPRVVFIVGIKGLRSLAHRTGEYAGCDLPHVEYGTEDSRLPVKATMTVYRFVQGQRVAFHGSALWDEFANPDDPFWLQKPTVCIERCAEASALRRAFVVIGNVYTTEEWSRSRRLARLGAGGDGSAGAGGDAVGRENVARVRTAEQFEQGLIGLGARDAEQRRAIVAQLADEMPQLAGDDPARFYAEGLAAVRANPRGYGLSAAAA